MNDGMVIIPAIDMKGGRCVRLKQGRAEDETVYADDPVAMAHRWEDSGAEYLHLVDLDGAFQGAPAHVDFVLRIARELKIPVEIGGGIRTEEQLARYLEGGVDRVILGTRACEAEDALQRLVDRFGAGVAVGIDARDGFVQVKGWTETTALTALDLAKRMERLGVKTIIYTDTARDGMMRGVNAEAMAAMCDAVGCSVVASGGVTTAEDVRALAALERKNLSGVIVGKALYEGTVTMKELLCI
ncbi:MAG: 1-(5-phosphoribosyl)-5-[(5-phosphoribosylamino)methylideneamino]imidazole-4-carboxamide isomerase [Kiritimatiellae bacterium]|nr:1-(5-phosphoribosyl)-5-[(5-phosphoribosylamino)methylideneamino]imidazole-4-carboxamide isomerase [Kiritimatiellia bacterium]MDD4736981.1 1-(5-phosphoribosyl)-5-[(5-phosphoribosylamino)methylideneamino]imidazole-4-carboxamide isomerase [Kiritimatiellia bacterium]